MADRDGWNSVRGDEYGGVGFVDAEYVDFCVWV